jgi:hypothetical protein
MPIYKLVIHFEVFVNKEAIKFMVKSERLDNINY